MRADPDVLREAITNWPDVLVKLDVDPECLTGRPTACPICGGTDRFRFTNQNCGGSFCNQCGARSPFQLLQAVHGWTFAEAVRQVRGAADMQEDVPRVPRQVPVVQVAEPPQRVLDLLRGCCRVDLVDEAVAYLASRHVWPLPPGCDLLAHVGAPYWESGSKPDEPPKLKGKYPALVARVYSRERKLATVHVTYLHRGKKLDVGSPRKLWSSMTGHVGCAVRLAPVGSVLGIAEGIETALAARLTDPEIPVWAATNATLLGKFVPPGGVTTLVIYADFDVAGLEAATICMSAASAAGLTVRCELPPRLHGKAFKDFADALHASAMSRDYSGPRRTYWWEK